jgi:hypothetical protein
MAKRHDTLRPDTKEDVMAADDSATGLATVIGRSCGKAARWICGGSAAMWVSMLALTWALTMVRTWVLVSLSTLFTSGMIAATPQPAGAMSAVTVAVDCATEEPASCRQR